MHAIKILDMYLKSLLTPYINREGIDELKYKATCGNYQRRQLLISRGNMMRPRL